MEDELDFDIRIIVPADLTTCGLDSAVEFIGKEAFGTEYELNIGATEVVEIIWPDTLATIIGESCVTRTETEVDFTGVSGLSNKWAKISLDDRTITIEGESDALST